jgi:hypothetical protein
MRVIIAAVFMLLVASALSGARADPYRWCAVYSGGELGSGGSNCYFLTLEQCRAAISGMGGFCEPNQFYDGQPVRTPEDAPLSRRRSPARR